MLAPALVLTAGLAFPQGDPLQPPVRLKAGNEYVKVEEPGYASPCWADVDGDKKKDLVVGQFRDGKLQVFRNLGKGKLAEGKWLEADGQPAEVPGVW